MRTLAWFFSLGLALGPAATAGEERIPHELYRLPNGLTVILHEDHRLPLVVVDVWYRVGAKDERPGRTGLAHLFEHLMFMGTARAPSFDQPMEAVGGWNNASTNEDRTNYFSVGPAHTLPLLLWLEADRLEALGRGMSPDKVGLQRDVVRNELRQGYENRPYSLAWLQIPGALWPAGHPYAHPVIGSHADLEAVDADEVRAFFYRHYTPSNASLVVAGDFEPGEARRLVEAYFGPLPAGPAPEPVRAGELAPLAARRLTVPDRVPLPQLLMLWRSPALYQPGDAELDALAGVLSQGKASRLVRRLVQEERLASEVQAYQSSGLLGSSFVIAAKALPGHALSELEAAIDGELAALRSSGPTAEELERARNRRETAFVRGLEPLFARADQLNAYLFYRGTPDYLAADLARYRGLEPAGVLAAARQALAPEWRLIVEIVPAGEAAPPAGGAP
ncbi:MAG TPA: pitrilysin family protein [Myxococcota bacterium]|nr:pitrilysin family protein [Myxococcota bacterium]HRY92887.1 pitrilysin family protein [Myxococcota bacterium]HSA21519.1 pitrilysin family protein [Myxococcota bacterium]